MATAGAFVVAASIAAQAASRGIRPPLVLSGADARAWVVLSSGGPSRAEDALVLDEYGELWWARVSARHAHVTRRCWPEEAGLCAEAIRACGESILAVRVN
jgi:hypothetical protein